MPMQPYPQRPAMAPNVAYDYGAGGFNSSPLLTGPAPQLPDPTMAATPPMANSTGGPAGPQADVRSGVYSSLYRIGKQMQGRSNMFEHLNPNPEPVQDPLAWMQPAPVEQPRQMPALPPAPPAPTPDQYPIHLRPQQAAPQRPIDRFPGLANRVGGAPMQRDPRMMRGR